MPQPLRLQLVGDTVITATFQGWAGKSKGELIALGNGGVRCDGDGGSKFELSTKHARPQTRLGSVSTANKKRVLVNAPRILAAIKAAEAGSYTFVDFGY